MTINIRDFRESDAKDISALFRAVYEERYTYPDIYLPTMIRYHNRQRRWRTAVAIKEECIVGHAILWQKPDDEQGAELAMVAVHPSVRGKGVATMLGKHLCDYAHKQGLDTLTIKMVSSHTYTQRLAHSLGFHTTGLLLDYVSSPFSHFGRESVILGVLPLQARPIPLDLIGCHYAQWGKRIAEQFGTTPPPVIDKTFSNTQVSSQGERIDVVLENAAYSDFEEIATLPSSRLIHIYVRIHNNVLSLLPMLHKAGYVDMGIAPASKNQWYLLLQRGFTTRGLDLCCKTACSIYKKASKQWL